MTIPDPLPPLTTVVDSAGIATALVRELGATPGYVIISLAADSTGEWTRVRIINSSLAPTTNETLVPLVSEHLRPANGTRRMRLRIDVGERNRFELGASQMCRPEMRNANEIERLLEAATAGIPDRGVVVVQVETNELGRPGEILVSRSSGASALDAIAVRIAARMLFYPALNDGVPVEVWSEIPLVFH